MSYFPNSLFSFARYGIESHWDEFSLKHPEILPELENERASFVTLTINNVLRGCVGSLVANRPLWKDIENNGFNAAFRDYRFEKLSREEYGEICVEVSVLTPAEQVFFKSESELRNLIRPDIDGIIYSCNGRRATFLPQVWEQLPDFERFFSHLSLKTGLGSIPDFENCTIERYQVERYHE